MDAKQLLDNLSTHLKNTIARAIALAASFNAGAVTPGHLLTAIGEETGSIGADLLKKFNISSTAIRQAIRAEGGVSSRSLIISQETKTATLPPLNRASKQALEKAMLVAYERSHTYVGTEHLLYGLAHCSDPMIDAILTEAGCHHDALDEHLDTVFQGASRFPNIEDADDMLDHMHHLMEEAGDAPLPIGPGPLEEPAQKTDDGKGEKHRAPKKQLSALDVFTINLTAKEMQEKIDPVIGREREIERLTHILCRRTKNNPILVGEPGVGKTAIVEGLAKHIAAGTVPDVLKCKKVLSLDLTLLIAGTIYRGEFEARLRQIIDEVSRDPQIILFIDEIHNIIGAGSNAGAMDAANMLKPALARGNLRCIGATTLDEYQKHIKGDPALERRFQSIPIEEPSIEETHRIASGIKSHYEQFHGTSITDDAVETAVRLSAKYIHDNQLPDKAIDLLDEASARVRAQAGVTKEERELLSLEETLRRLREEKQQAIAQESFEAAMKLKKKIEALEAQFESMKKAIKKLPRQARKKVTKEDVAAVVASRLSLDPALLLESEWEALKTLPTRLGEHIVGQKNVQEGIAERLRHAQLTSSKGKRPFASFLFAGPSGVGKTRMAKALAHELYHDEKALIKFDMSEFAEPHSVSKILGSPAGYIGYNERNRFTDDIRRRPYSVILFDEFDKAHPDVRRLLLQVLDEGELTDSHGKKISFAHAIIVLTTNVGAELFKSAGIGFGGASVAADAERLSSSVYDRLKEEFNSAILGRLSSVLLFSPLTKDHIAEIIRRHIEEMNRHLTDAQRISIEPEADAIQALAEEKYTTDFGARNIERAVEDTVHRLLSPLLSKAKRKKIYRLTKTENRYMLK